MRLGIFTNKMRRLLTRPIFLLIFVVTPAVLSILLGTLLQETVKQSVIPIAIVDRDHSKFSNLIIARMKENKGIEVIELEEASAIRALKRGQVDTVFIIKQSFEERLLEEKREETVELWATPLSMATGIVKEMLGSEIIRISSHVKAGNWVTDVIDKTKGINEVERKNLWEKAYNYSESQWDPEPLMTVQYETKNTEETGTGTIIPRHTSYIGYWTFFTMLFSFMLTESFIRDRRSLIVRIRGMYNNVETFMIQTGMAYFVILLMQMCFTLAILQFFNLIDFHISQLWLILFFLFFCLTISIGLACYSKHIGLYYGIALLLALIISMASNVFFPITDLYENIALVSGYLPQDWVISGKGKHLLEASAFCLFIWGMSIWKLEREHD